MAVTQNGNTSARSLDEHLDVLGDDHRRAVVEILAEDGRSVRLSALAESVAAETRDVSPEAVAHGDVERTKVELHHHHLPKLDAAGVLEYDYEENRAAPTENLQSARDAVKSVVTA